MTLVGRVESLWRYPVKSMRGEELGQAFLGFAGVYGDRFYAFLSSAARKGFPYLTGRQKEEMLLYRPMYRHPEHMLKPPNLEETEAGNSTPIYPDSEEIMVDVATAAGDLLAINDPQLITRLREGLDSRHELRLIRSHRSLTDCRPVSLFSLQTVRHLSEEVGADLDKRRFRANIYVDLESRIGFSEEEFLGRKLRIGAKAVVAVVDRDTRCKMITLDPDTAQANPEIIRTVRRSHDGNAGVYGTVVVEGIVSPGDEIVPAD